MTDDDIEKIFEFRELGTSCPASLLKSIWLNNTLQFELGQVGRNIEISSGVILS